MICGIISAFTDKGQFQYLTNLKGPQEGTYLYILKESSNAYSKQFTTKYQLC